MNHRHAERRREPDRRTSTSAALATDRRAGDRRAEADRRHCTPDPRPVLSTLDPLPAPIRSLRRFCARVDEIESRLGLGTRKLV